MNTITITRKIVIFAVALSGRVLKWRQSVAAKKAKALASVSNALQKRADAASTKAADCAIYAAALSNEAEAARSTLKALKDFKG